MDELDIPPERAQCEGYFCFAASQHALQRAEPRPGYCEVRSGRSRLESWSNAANCILCVSRDQPRHFSHVSVLFGSCPKLVGVCHGQREAITKYGRAVLTQHDMFVCWLFRY